MKPKQLNWFGLSRSIQIFFTKLFDIYYIITTLRVKPLNKGSISIKDSKFKNNVIDCNRAKGSLPVLPM